MRRLFATLIILTWGCNYAFAQVPFEYGPTAPQSTYTTTRQYLLGGTTPVTGAASTASVITCIKGFIYAPVTLSVLSVNISTIGTSNVQSALYADTGGLPGALYSSTPSVVDTSTLAAAMTLSTSVQLGVNGRNSAWFCTNQNDSTVVFTSNTRTGLSASITGSKLGTTGFATEVAGAANIAGISCTGANCNGGSSTFGTWPATLAGSTWTDVVGVTAPLLVFTPLSVP